MAHEVNRKKTISVVISRFRAIVLGYGGTELEEVKSMRILGVIFYSKWTFEIHLRELVPEAARNQEIVLRVGKLFDCPRVLKSCFNAYVLSSFEYCAESLGEGELCCLGHRRKVCGVCLLYKIYHRVDHPMNAYPNNFVVVLSTTRASAALGELVLVIPHCRTDLLSQSFLPAIVYL